MQKLILLPTTIGNIEDTSFRVLRYVFESPVIYAEDTRVFQKYKTILKERFEKLFSNLEIMPLPQQLILSYREQNHDRVVAQILNTLKDADVVIVTDAGIPGISDPGFRLVETALANGVELDVIPGPSAVTTALVLSGLPTDYFAFVGFLPRKRIRIKKLLENYNLETCSVVFFESPFRVVKTLEILQELFSEKLHVAACGEMTKRFQRIERGTVSSVLEKFKERPPKGEWSIVIREG